MKKVIFLFQLFLISHCLLADGRKICVPDDCKSIQSAIDTAQAGDTVFVKAGVYEESLNMKDGVNLIGEDANKVVIQLKSELSKDLIEINCKSCKVKGFTFKHIGVDRAERRPVGVHLINSSAEIADCNIGPTVGQGIVIMDGGNPYIHDCRIKLNGYSGICVLGSGTSPIIKNNIISNNQSAGIAFESGSGGLVEGNISQNNQNGIFAKNKETKVELIKNICRGNSKNGIIIFTGAKADITGNICENNSNAGILVFEQGSSAILNENICRDNNQPGIWFADGSTGEAKKNLCQRNKQTGIKISGQFANVFLESNKCIENNGNGIYFRWESAGVAARNICSNNTSNGISISGDCISPQLKENECSNNDKSGIYYGDGAWGPVENNKCKNNKLYGIVVNDVWSIPELKENECSGNGKKDIYIEQGNFGNVRQLLIDEKFDELEKKAVELLKSKSKSGYCRWNLSDFYQQLSNRWETFTPSKEHEIFSKVEKWRKAKPNSLAARLVLAKLYIKFGWKIRSCDWAYKVKAEAWENFYKYLNKGWEILKEGEDSDVNNPALYVTYLTLCRGLEKPVEEAEKYFDKGVAIEPLYLSLYTEMAIILNPKWSGSEEELADFADKAFELNKNSEGYGIYAIIASDAIPKSESVNPDDLLKFNFDYSKIKRGFTDILNQYPNDKYYLNTFCFVASIYKDKETAVKLFEKIGDDWDQEAWCCDKNFNKYKNRAYKK
jgi:parallel beta-helix repeat protein